MISVIVPTYDEEKALPKTLTYLLRQPGHYEVIIADGGSTDRTLELVRAHQGVRWLTAAKGRASQMNAGVGIARGEWLLFLHADTLLPKGALLRIDALTENTSCQAGGFRHRFSGKDWRLALISWMDNMRARMTRVIYGDQALFVRRALFERLGGFPEDQPFLEDIRFCERLKRVTRPVLLDACVITDSRKFVQMGIWGSTARCALILACHILRLPIVGRAFFADVR